MSIQNETQAAAAADGLTSQEAEARLGQFGPNDPAPPKLNSAVLVKSRRAIEQLRQQVVPTAAVLRDGKWRELRRSDVVPGDIVRLSTGDLLPAERRTWFFWAPPSSAEHASRSA
jgi:hypothetical protein